MDVMKININSSNNAQMNHAKLKKEYVAKKETVEQVSLSKAPISNEKAKKIIEEANTKLRECYRRIEYSIHDKTSEVMIKVINTRDDSVVREIPSERILDFVAHVQERIGIIVDESR